MSLLLFQRYARQLPSRLRQLRAVRPCDAAATASRRSAVTAGASPRALSTAATAATPPSPPPPPAPAPVEAASSSDLAEDAAAAAPPPAPGGDDAATFESTLSLIAHTSADGIQAFHTTMLQDLLPWCATLPLVALALRTLTLPLVYHRHLHAARAELAARELPRIHHFVRNAPGSLLQKYATFRRLRRLVLRSAGTSPLQQVPVHVLLHAPLLLAASLGVRELAHQAPQAWACGGPFFAPDLLAPDPTAALPLLTTAVWLWNLAPPPAKPELRPPKVSASVLVALLTTRLRDGILTTLQMGAVVSLVATTSLPSGLVLFWCSNAILTAAQRLALSSDALRTRLGIMTATQIAAVPPAPIMPAIENSVEAVRKELSYVQQMLAAMFKMRKPDLGLVDDVNRMLQRERFAGRVASNLVAVLRYDDRDGRPYIAVVKKGVDNGNAAAATT